MHADVTATADGRELLLKLPETLKQLVIYAQDSCAPLSKCAAQTLVNITGDESGTNAMLIISESSNSTEKNKSSKQNVSDMLVEIRLTSTVFVLCFCSVSRTFRNLMKNWQQKKRTESGYFINRIF